MASENGLGFARARLDLGYPSANVEAGVGLGQAKVVTLSLEGAARLSLNDVVGAAHARFETDGFVLRAGPLYERAYQRGFLHPAPSYELREIDRVSASPVGLWALHAEALCTLPLYVSRRSVPDLWVESESEAFAPADPDQSDFYWWGPWNTVLGPGLALRQRIGFRYELPVWRGLFLEPTVEIVWAEARGGVPVMRAGFLAALSLNEHFSLRARVLPAVEARDRVGLAGGQALTLTLRYDGALVF